MRIAAISDLHGHLPDIDPCDLLLLGGDVCHGFGAAGKTTSQRAHLDGPFRRWLERVPARHIVGVAGNHDFIFQQSPEQVPTGLRWQYLQDEHIEIDGLKVYGTPWQPWFGGWAFNAHEPELQRRWAQVPPDIDILVCHSPPTGYGDVNGRGEHAGSSALLDLVHRIAPRLTIFGHIHEARGQWMLTDAERGRTCILANVSHVDSSYAPMYPAMTFDIAGNTANTGK